MVKRSRPAITITKIAIAIAAVTTVMAMIASGSIVLSGGRNFEENIHSVAMGIMLIAYLFLIVVLMNSKNNQLDTLSVVDQERFLVVSPCTRDSYLILDQVGIDSSLQALASLSKRRRASVRIVVARDVSIQAGFLDSLANLPNVSLLDVQHSKVAPQFWANLEDLPNLSHVLATDAIPSDVLRNISIALPEVKFWLGLRRQLVIGSKRAMSPGGC